MEAVLNPAGRAPAPVPACLGPENNGRAVHEAVEHEKRVGWRQRPARG
jgi:hypothetical protein